MDEEMEYAEMLEIPVSTVKVTKKRGRKPKAQKEQQAQQEQLRERIATTADAVATSKKYKLNEVNSGIDKKSKKVLAIVSDILSTKLSKFLVDEIIEEIINKLNGK